MYVYIYIYIYDHNNSKSGAWPGAPGDLRPAAGRGRPGTPIIIIPRAKYNNNKHNHNNAINNNNNINMFIC